MASNDEHDLNHPAGSSVGVVERDVKMPQPAVVGQFENETGPLPSRRVRPSL